MVTMFGLSKGRANIQVNREIYDLGETIDGTVFLDIKKAFVSKKITITLLVRAWKRRGRNRVLRTLHEDSITIENQEFHVGQHPTLPFSFKIPEGPSIQEKEAALAQLPEKMQKAFVTANKLGITQRKLWGIRVHVHVPGLFNDIIATKQIKVGELPSAFSNN